MSKRKLRMKYRQYLFSYTFEVFTPMLDALEVLAEDNVTSLPAVARETLV